MSGVASRQQDLRCICAGSLIVMSNHLTGGAVLKTEGTAEGYVAAADALLYEAFKTMPIDAVAPDGTPVHELHDRARDALRGMLAGLAA